MLDCSAATEGALHETRRIALQRSGWPSTNDPAQPQNVIRTQMQWRGNASVAISSAQDLVITLRPTLSSYVTVTALTPTISSQWTSPSEQAEASLASAIKLLSVEPKLREVALAVGEEFSANGLLPARTMRTREGDVAFYFFETGVTSSATLQRYATVECSVDEDGQISIVGLFTDRVKNLSDVRDFSSESAVSQLANWIRFNLFEQ